MATKIDMTRPFKLTRNNKPVASYDTETEATEAMQGLALVHGPEGIVLDTPLAF